MGGADEPGVESELLRETEVLSVEAPRARRQTLKDGEVEPTFHEGDVLKMLKPHHEKIPSLEAKWKGPFTVEAVSHPRYTLRDSPGKRSDGGVHVRRLRPYHSRGE